MTDSNAPKPGTPKPGSPKPGAAKPGAAKTAGAPKSGPASAHAPHTAAPSNPSLFGRVDDDGTAWVKTADGERQIGSWQAGDAAEGLAHFGRRYDDLATEVALLEARLASGAGDPKKTRSAAEALAETLPTAAVIGDIDALSARLAAIVEGSEQAATQAKQEKDQSRQEQTARKEALAAEAEQLGNESTQWKAAGDRLREILDEWKTLRGLDRKTDDALWKRFSKAREAFNRRRGTHFAELDRERATAKTRKEELVAQAEALSGSTDWGPTAGAFRDLLAEWKAAGRAPRDADDALWRRFKEAQDVFFAARNAAASSTPTRTSMRLAPPCANSRRSGTRSARSPASACTTSRASSARSRSVSARPPTPSGVVPIPRRWRVPPSSASVSRSSRSRPRRPRPPARPRTPRRRSLRPSSGVSGPRRPRARSTSAE